MPASATNVGPPTLRSKDRNLELVLPRLLLRLRAEGQLAFRYLAAQNRIREWQIPCRYASPSRFLHRRDQAQLQLGAAPPMPSQTHDDLRTNQGQFGYPDMSPSSGSLQFVCHSKPWTAPIVRTHYLLNQ